MKVCEMCCVLLLCAFIISCKQSKVKQSSARDSTVNNTTGSNKIQKLNELLNDKPERKTFSLPGISFVDLEEMSRCFYIGDFKNDLALDFGQFFFSVNPQKGDTLNFFHEGIGMKVWGKAIFNIRVERAQHKAMMTVYKGTVSVYVGRNLTPVHGGQSVAIVRGGMGYITPPNLNDSAWRHKTKVIGGVDSTISIQNGYVLIKLNNGSKVQLEYASQNLLLITGQAYVAVDSARSRFKRPLTIVAGGIAFQCRHGEFNINASNVYRASYAGHPAGLENAILTIVRGRLYKNGYALKENSVYNLGQFGTRNEGGLVLADQLTWMKKGKH